MDSFLLPSPHSMDQPGAGSSQTYHPLHSRCHNSLGKTTILNKPGPHLMDPKLWCNQWPPGNSNDGQLYLLKLIWKDTWSEQKRGGYGFWTYQISFNAFNETWGEGRFLGCSTLPLKKDTIHLSLSQIREQLQHVTLHLQELSAGLSH